MSTQSKISLDKAYGIIIFAVFIFFVFKNYEIDPTEDTNARAKLFLTSLITYGSTSWCTLQMSLNHLFDLKNDLRIPIIKNLIPTGGSLNIEPRAFGFLYVFLVFFFATAYLILSYIEPESFKEKLLDASSWIDPLYFSVTTITTLGYGDVTPVSKWAKLLTVLESIAGVLVMGFFLYSLSEKRQKELNIRALIVQLEKKNNLFTRMHKTFLYTCNAIIPFIENHKDASTTLTSDFLESALTKLQKHRSEIIEKKKELGDPFSNLPYYFSTVHMAKDDILNLDPTISAFDIEDQIYWSKLKSSIDNMLEHSKVFHHNSTHWDKDPQTNKYQLNDQWLQDVGLISFFMETSLNSIHKLLLSQEKLTITIQDLKDG